MDSSQPGAQLSQHAGRRFMHAEEVAGDLLDEACVEGLIHTAHGCCI